MLSAATHRCRHSIHGGNPDGAVLHQSHEGEIVAAPIEVNPGIAEHDGASTLDIRQNRTVGFRRFAYLEFEIELPLPLQARDAMGRLLFNFEREPPSKIVPMFPRCVRSTRPSFGTLDAGVKDLNANQASVDLRSRNPIRR